MIVAVSMCGGRASGRSNSRRPRPASVWGGRDEDDDQAFYHQLHR
jgi:hypothetical protein